MQGCGDGTLSNESGTCPPRVVWSGGQGNNTGDARQHGKFMALLDKRAKQTHTIPLEEVKRQLDLEA